MSTRRITPHIAALLAGLAASDTRAIAAPPEFRIDRLGLYGPGYTNAQGLHSSFASRLSPSGDVIGYSRRYNAAGTILGDVPWLGREGVTTRLGFFDADHTAPDGAQISVARGISATGGIAGSSNRYNSTSTASTAWLFENNAYTILGLTDPAHTDMDGRRSAGVAAISASGDTAGSSRRYTASGTFNTAWIRRAGLTTPAGLTDAEHTDSQGRQNSFSLFLSNSGVAAGQSSRFSASGSLGTSAWINDGQQTRRIGLTGPQYVSTDGSSTTNLFDMSSAGIAIGATTQYAPGSLGNHTWFATPDGVTTRIGLSDTEHTRGSFGTQYSEPREVNAAGDITGRAFRYASNGGSAGESAWIYSSGQTIRIGLTDAEHTNQSNQFQFNRAVDLAANGSVLGVATRANTPAGGGGQSAWVYSNGTTRRVGLFDAEHTGPTAFQFSQAIAINATGDAIGSSSQYSLLDPSFAGQSGWFYDAATTITHRLSFSISSFGTVETNPMMLLDNRTVLGSYRDFDSSSTRLFWWTLDQGVFDITDFVQGGIESADWIQLSSIFSAAAPGSFDGTTIVGTGRAVDVAGTAVFVLSPIPTPSATALISMFACFAARRRRYHTPAAGC